MPRADQYRHLNDVEGDGVRIGIEAIARQVDALNYGTHRLLSAIVRVRRETRANDELANGIEALLNRGLF